METLIPCQECQQEELVTGIIAMYCCLAGEVDLLYCSTHNEADLLPLLPGIRVLALFPDCVGMRLIGSMGAHSLLLRCCLLLSNQILWVEMIGSNFLYTAWARDKNYPD